MPMHAVIWIDHKEARIFHVRPEAADETTVLAPQHHLHDTKGRGGSTGHTEEARRFFSEVARTLGGVDALLIVGPSSAKLEFFRYLHEHDLQLESKVVGVESADHPTDGEIVARAKNAFKVSDRMG